jgi:addiction module RelB/DinJ family antitoxin
MNTKTILNIKMDKTLKEEARKTAEELGIPLSTAINAFLKNFVREKEITLSANTDMPTPYLQKVIKEAEEEYVVGESSGPFEGKEVLDFLKSL